MSVLKIWNGSAWEVITGGSSLEGGAVDHGVLTGLDDNDHPQYSLTGHGHAASAISFTPTGTIAATTVQAAIAEVANEAVGGGSAGLGTFTIDARETFPANYNSAIDESPYLQELLDYGEDLGSNPHSYPAVELPNRQISLKTPVTLRSVPIIGQWWNSATRLIWNGAAGATVFSKSNATVTYEGRTSTPIGNAYYRLSKLSMHGGSAQPETWLDLTNDQIDQGFLMDFVQFHDCTGTALKIGQYFNLHWNNMRFDNWGEWAVEVAPATWGNLASFVIDKFTADHTIPSSSSKGFILFKTPTVAGPVNSMGTAVIQHGRIEINQPFNAAEYNSIFAIEHNESASVAGPGSGAKPSLVHRNQVTVAQGSARDMLLGVAITQQNLSAVLTGDWPVQMTQPALQSYYPILEAGSMDASVLAQPDIHVNSNSTYAMRVFRGDGAGGTETNPRFAVGADGKTWWGRGGANAPSTNMYESAADKLKTDDRFIASGGIVTNSGPTASRPLNADTGQMYIDTTINKTIWYYGSAWKDADGTTV
jgi:hypothetical protein